MIYYPLSTLMIAGIRDILVITKKEDLRLYKNLFEDGKQLGLNISYKVQENPNGIAEAFIIAEDFIDKDDVCLILGDNLFYGADLIDKVDEGKSQIAAGNAVIFGYRVSDPKEYGVVRLSKHGRILDIEEKPKKPRSNTAVVGLYMYNSSVVDIAKNITPSARGELEITAVNNEYLKQKKLSLVMLTRGYAYFDTGTHDSMLEASNFISIIQKRQSLFVACLEEIAYNRGYISKEQLLALVSNLGKNKYSDYLYRIIEEENELD